VIAGVAKGRRLVAPKGDRTRPTSDRVKESWFSTLQPLLGGAHVLDLYAGSGALGLEALSRGAAAVTFVEKDRRALDALRTNLAAVDLPGATVVGRDVQAALAEALLDAPFDVVVADPPYRADEAEVTAVLATLVRHLAPGAVVTLERGRREPVPAWPAELSPDDPRRYGDTTLHRARLVPPEHDAEEPDDRTGP
jgi:16S rRNA (guanine966-N2)-methyltransferase